MSKSTGLPNVIFLGPELHREAFRNTLFIVRERDYDGVPRILELVREDSDDDFETEGAADVVTGYLPECVTRPYTGEG